MARLSLTKASLSKEKRQLKVFQDVLPSLDLKRRQLIAERSKAKRMLAEIQKRLQKIDPEIAQQIPMLSNQLVDLTNIVQVTAVELVEENVRGTELDYLKSNKFKSRCAITPYSANPSGSIAW